MFCHLLSSESHGKMTLIIYCRSEVLADLYHGATFAISTYTELQPGEPAHIGCNGIELERYSGGGMNVFLHKMEHAGYESS